MIDISGLKSVFVDPDNQVAIVEAGNTFEDLNPILESYGMHLPGGGCPTVSVAGFMQGGGYGLTSRRFGIQSDCVLEFKMILADGSIPTGINPAFNGLIGDLITGNLWRLKKNTTPTIFSTISNRSARH